MPRSLVFLLFISFLFLHIHAISPTRYYNHGPVPFDKTASLYYSLSKSNSTFSFALVVTDPKIASNSTRFVPNWLGLGVSEPTSGSMLGADIVTAVFRPDGSCVFTDRYVPFFAFPLGEPGPGGTAFPREDDCQEDGSWTYIGCKRDGETVLLEVERKLEAHDAQDRAIKKEDGLSALIYAYGNDFGYHQGRRGAMQVDLFAEKKGSEAQIKLPADVDGSFEILATNYTVPQSETVYACTSMVVELDKSDKLMIVAAEPIIQAETDMVHHLVLYLCSGDEYAKTVRKTVECTTADNNIGGPVGNPQAKCSTLVYGYAKGSSRFVLPPEAGILVTSSKHFLVMESHYDNPEDIADNVDASGVRVYYTNTVRKYEAGSLSLGDPLVSRDSETVISEFKYEHTCPSECTSKHSKPITVFGSFLHMHTTGKEIYSNKFARNGTFLEKVGSINFWSDRFQNLRLLSRAIILRPGEQFATTCIYDTSKRPDTAFGLSTINEMCVNFLLYYPVQRDSNRRSINSCGLLQEEDGNYTLCADHMQIEPEMILQVKNPKFRDAVGAPLDFGDPVETCEAEVTPTVSMRPEESEPSITSENGASDDESACFPADARVRLRQGGTKRMEDVVVGDDVAVGYGKYSTVFMMTHADRNRVFSFVELTVSGQVLCVSLGHYVHVQGKLKKAAEVKVGDWMLSEKGKKVMVEHVGTVWKRGLLNPQTNLGDIVVEGLIVSTFTERVPPSVAQVLLAPSRWAYWYLGFDMSWLFPC